MRMPWGRWMQFNLIGVAGAVVQLGSLHVLNRYLAGHYLWATAIALELTLLHNFCWHLRYTWRERNATRRWPGQLVRFHIASGTVSFAGNLLVMRWLVGQEHIIPVVANTAAIVVCSLLNFLLSDRWAFAVSRAPEHSCAKEVGASARSLC